jgi:hypothetical protein
MDIAEEYPSASVTGVDLSPIQPEFVPVNCSFEIDDVTEEWTYPPKHFDFIHIREMFGSIRDWDSFFHEVYRCTKPGGWVEVVEHAVEAKADDVALPPDHFYHKWTGVLVEMGAKTGKSWDIWKEAKDRMLKAGFVDVVEIPFKWPMNGWPNDRKLKEIGRFNQYRLNEGAEGFTLRLLTNVAQVSRSAWTTGFHSNANGNQFAVVLRAGAVVCNGTTTYHPRLFLPCVFTWVCGRLSVAQRLLLFLTWLEMLSTGAGPPKSEIYVAEHLMKQFLRCLLFRRLIPPFARTKRLNFHTDSSIRYCSS